jgi:uncharacterized protein (TIGR03083 family)
MTDHDDEMLAESVFAVWAQAEAVGAPAELRAGLLAAASTRPQQLARPAPSTPVEAYLHQADALSDLLAGLPAAAWDRPAKPYEWTVHGLVAHLLQIERYFARVVGGAGAPVGDERDHLALGAAEIEEELTRRPAEAVADWRAVVDGLRPALAGADLHRALQFHEWPMSLGSLLVARAFELWTHADDIRRAQGEGVVTPSAADIRVMSATSVGSLPLAVHVVTQHPPDASARIVLTGEGGGTWDLSIGHGGERAVTVVADVVGYCRLAARRCTLAELDAELIGDADLGRDLLRAATIIAV